uniref:11-oxo-beta-amyrin 30-oxidase n=1 Tax=Glycyrrhiza glabra TaxID=49827 RepID=A0A411JJD7_GLYGL|nr:11-oxo-beta-amyrin 30-oxidase [Glycyrrhiza glabra]
MDASSTPGAIWVVQTMVLAAIPLWACHMVNTLWLTPITLERHLKAQGLLGDPYCLSLLLSCPTYMLKLQKELLSKSMDLSKDDAAPPIFSLGHLTVHKYGTNSFAWEGTAPKVIITDPDEGEEVFNKIQDFPKPILLPIIKYITVGLFPYEGDKWAQHGKIIVPAFHLERLSCMLPSFSHICHDLIDKWKGLLSSDGTCDVDVWTVRIYLTCDVISRTAFYSGYAERAKIDDLLKMQGYALMTARYAHITLWWLLQSTTHRRMIVIDTCIRDSHESNMRKRAKELWSDQTTDDDLLRILLQSNHIENKGDENSKSAGMTTQEVMEECKLFYLAGQETTAALLAWTMVLLGKHPEWQARARQEVLQVFGNQNPNFEGLGRLKIVTMILYEVLRLYPPGIYLTRALQKDLKLGNLLLPAGVQVSVPILLIHHDEGIWGNDAKEFNPERFAEGIAKATKGQVCYFPFGWGPRICVGQNFVLLEAKIVLSLLLQNFSFELSPSYAHVPTTVLTLQPKHGAPIILHKL